MTRKRSYHSKTYSRRSKSQGEEIVRGISAIIIGLSILSYAMYNKFFKNNMETVIFYGKIGFIIFIFILLGLGFYMFHIHQKRKLEEKMRREQIPEYLRELEEKIKSFTPIKNYNKENLYQSGLIGHLQGYYPEIKMEKTRDYSRPDIIINDIAIELKGPTNMKELKTLPDKINSYIPKWQYLFIVLYSIELSEEEYFKKKAEILDNIIDAKKDKVFFIEHFKTQ